MSLSLATRGRLCPNIALGIVTRGRLCRLIEVVLEPVVFPPKYVHITDLVPGDEVKINVQIRHRFVPQMTKNGMYLRLEKGMPPRGYEKTVLLGRVLSNSPTAGSLKIQVAYDIFKQHFSADIPYHTIHTIQKIVPRRLIETATRPGEKALGTILPGGTLLPSRYDYIPVRL